MTIQKVLKAAYDQLSEESQSPQLDAELLLAHILKKNRSFLIAQTDKILSQKQVQRFRSLVARRSKGEPISYLIQKKEFYGLSFYVNSSVLIPRPETEQLVDLTMDALIKRIEGNKNKRQFKITDIGTGSGNIGITIISQIIHHKLHKRYKFTLYLTDISGTALAIAKKNCTNLIKNHDNIKIHFVKTDLLKGLNTKFDIIVSNPPYIPQADIDGLMKDVRDFEPHVALNGGEKGLSIIRKIIGQGVPLLYREGFILLEIHEQHPLRLRYYLKEAFPKGSITFHKDVFGEWRFALITHKSKLFVLS